MPQVEHLSAMEILDSRGRPTVQAACRLRGSTTVIASVPSGASTGSAEALELRDGDPKRYDGLGVRRAVANVNGEIAKALLNREFEQQHDLDRALLDLDGTPNKSRLGANAILAVSIAFARASAAAQGVPLYQHFAHIAGEKLRSLPRLTVNLFSGGMHAGGQVPIQDVLVVPVRAKTIEEGLAVVYDVYQAAAKLCSRKYNVRALKADEGGLAPPFEKPVDMLHDACDAIEAAGYGLEDVRLAVDFAASHFYRDGHYHFGGYTARGGGSMQGIDMVDLLCMFGGKFNIVSIEDGLAEEDWENWSRLRGAWGSSALILGDDFLCTNPTRIRKAIDANAANALLLKVNQIGTLTEAAEALKLAREAGWRVTISARSGETEDNWLADLSVGWAGDQIKVGSICQSERLAKYNRLLAIEAETNLPVVNWP